MARDGTHHDHPHIRNEDARSSATGRPEPPVSGGHLSRWPIVLWDVEVVVALPL